MEALAIAVAMREAREKRSTAALVTPDRALARRVMAALGRWNLDFDDSGGDSLMDTSAGIFARLVAEAAADELAPATLAGAAETSAVSVGQAQSALDDAICDARTGAAARHAAHARQRRDWRRLHALPRRTRQAPARRSVDAAWRRAARTTERRPLSMPRRRLIDGLAARAEAARRHQARQAASISPNWPCVSSQTYHSVVARRHEKDRLRLKGRDGSALSKAFDDLFAGLSRPKDDEKPLRERASMLALAIIPMCFRPPSPTALCGGRKPQCARLRIYGPLEARLTESDRVILGGLVEGVWPPAAARRSMAEPPDAASARPRSARAPHRPVRA